MTRNELIQTVKDFMTKHDLSPEDLYLGYEAAARLHQFTTECETIYIDVYDSIFDYIWSLDEGEIVRSGFKQHNGEHVRFGPIEVHNFPIDGCEPVFIAGLQVVGLERLREQFQYWVARSEGEDLVKYQKILDNINNTLPNTI